MPKLIIFIQPLMIELIKAKVIGEVRVIQASFSFHAGYNPDRRLFKNALGGGGILDVGCYTTSGARLIAGAAVGKDFADPIDVQGVAFLREPQLVDQAKLRPLRSPTRMARPG